VIFALSSIPSLGTGLGVWDTILRKGAHITEYAILALLLLRALGREAPAFLLGLAYAATDELHQHFVRGRHSSRVDVAIDAVGLALGLLVFRATVESALWPNGRASTTGSSTRSSRGSTPSGPSSRP
jgi:VanZ family protein